MTWKPTDEIVTTLEETLMMLSPRPGGNPLEAALIAVQEARAKALEEAAMCAERLCDDETRRRMGPEASIVAFTIAQAIRSLIPKPVDNEPTP